MAQSPQIWHLRRLYHLLPSEQLAIPLRTRLVGRYEQKGFVLALHVLVCRGAVEQSIQHMVQVVTQHMGPVIAVVGLGNVDHGALELGDDADDDGAHESDVAAPVGVRRDHAAGVLPCACVDLALDVQRQRHMVEVMGDVWWIVPAISLTGRWGLLLRAHCKNEVCDGLNREEGKQYLILFRLLMVFLVVAIV